MNIITYYKNDKIVKTEQLDKNTVKNCHGMKIKCTLLDGTEKIGFANTFYSFEKGTIVVGTEAKSLEYITLETFINLDEETNEFKGDEESMYDINREMVLINLISHIDALLCSGLRWGGIPTNKFQ